MNIIIVEDDAITSFLIKSFFEGSGINVTAVFDNAEDLIKSFTTYSECVYILDIMLSGEMSGIEAAEIIRESSNDPIIFISALSDKSSKIRIEAIETSVHLMKPFDLPELEAVASRLHSERN